MSAPLWTSAELAALPGAWLVGRSPAGDMPAVTSISIDTRTIQPGDLFVAIQGDARDGHDFVEAALAKGAAAAIVAESWAAEYAGAGALVAVPDPLGFLGEMAWAARARTDARIVAVTGSVGKTGTKEALRLVLSRFGRTHASAASYNNHWGVPLTLARMPRDSRFGVFEVGMNHPGEIVPLTRTVRPHLAIVTTIEPVHIAQFRSILGIADAKGEIFAGLEPGGVAIVNRDTPYWDRLAAHAAASPAGRIVGFGEHETADVRALRIVAGPDASMVEARVFGRPVTYRIGMAGRHVALNSLAVLAAVSALGLDPAEAAGSFGDLTAPSGRGERFTLRAGGGAFTLIDESYNANPASMRAAFGAVGAIVPGAGGRRIAVVADMLELGESGPAAHAGLAEPLAANDIDLVFAAGPLMRDLWSALPAARRGGYAESAADLEPLVLDAMRAGDVVTVKGSNSTRVSRIVAALKARFGDAPAATASGRG